MKANESLLDAIGNVRDEYVLEAHEDPQLSAQDAGDVIATEVADNSSNIATFDAEAAANETSASGEVLNREDGGPYGSADEEADERVDLSVVPGGRDQAPHTSARSRRVIPALVLLGVAASLVGAIILVQGGLNASRMSAETRVFNDASASGGPAVGEEAVTESLVASPMTKDGASASSAPTSSMDGFAGVGVGMRGYDEADVADALVLTAAEWNDNANWPFFSNLVGSGIIRFPVFGLDPRYRVSVSLTDESGAAVRGQELALYDDAGNELWRTRSDKDGMAYLFYREGQVPTTVISGGARASVSVTNGGEQGGVTQVSDHIALTVPAVSAPSALQVMFIVDTTGSMGDELAYLQKDFSAIAADLGAQGVEYSANFYRDEGDEYVTKCNPFTSDVATVQAQLLDEYAAGGGDTPEAVSQILTECITKNDSWRDDAAKLVFLVFDAPPHDGADAMLEAAVRSAATRGIRLVPVVASNAERETELFGRALAIMTNGTYVFLTDDSGVGDAHLTPIVGEHTVELLHDIIVRLIEESR